MPGPTLLFQNQLHNFYNNVSIYTLGHSPTLVK